MAHIKGNFVVRGFELPKAAGPFKLELPSSEWHVLNVLPQGAASVVLIEYALPAQTTAAVPFEAVADDVWHTGLPANYAYLGTYSTISGGVLHLYGPRNIFCDYR